MKSAIGFLTKDRTELTRQALPPLLDAARNGHFHLFVYDGSTTEANERAIWELAYPTGHMTANVRGGAGAAIVFALTELLNHSEGYDVIGLVENDVLLLDGWLVALDLFERGQSDGFEVGAVSARCFEDRILFQRDGYAVVHNLGAGCVFLSRKAVQIILDTFRTGWTIDNRRVFSQLCGIDIGHYWAFRGQENALTADWHWETALAAHGLASLALTPSPCEMIGQVPPLDEQGLHIAKSEQEQFRNNDVFALYRENLTAVREGRFLVGVDTKFQFNPATCTWTYFPHQMAMLGGKYTGNWKLKELRGWGTFGWQAEGEQWDRFDNISLGTLLQLKVPVFGSVAVLASGGEIGGRVEVLDLASGFTSSPELIPEGEQGQVLSLMIPGGINTREIQFTALSPGVVFYGIQSRERQPHLPNISFNFSTLPPP